MAYDDYLWEVLERLGMADFFEDHGIPPIIFPVAILVIAAVIILFLMPAGVEESTGYCGDAICQHDLDEDADSCPQDCGLPMTPKTVLVDIIDQVESGIDVFLEDSAGDVIYSTGGVANKFKITDVLADSVKVTVRNPLNSMTVSSDYVQLREETTKIPMGLPANFFDASSTVPPEKATLRVVLRDAETGELASAKVTTVIPNGGSYVLAGAQDINGTGYFTLDASQDYAIIVDARGYRQYNTLSSPIRLDPRSERELVIELDPLPSDQSSEEGASLEVCVRNQTGGAILSGSVEVYTAARIRLVTRSLSSSGCAQFELQAGDLVLLTTANLPTGCVDATSDPMRMVSGRNELTLTARCDSDAQGRARAKIIGEDDGTITDEATITAWYASGQQIYGSGYGQSLSMAAGGYTEYLRVASSTPFNFLVTNLEGYPSYRSENYVLEPLEDKSIDLHLARTPLSDRNITFLGVAYPDPTFPNQVFTVTIPTVMLGNSDITNLAQVSVALGGIDCDTTKEQFWIARCTSPSQPGSYALSLSATYEGKHEVDTREMRVLDRGTGLFTLELIGLPDTDPPILLEFNVTFNGTPLDSLTGSNVTISYVLGDTMVTDQLSLSGSDGLYTVTVDSPFSGEHRAEIKLMKIKYGTLYEQEFTVSFMVSGLDITALERIEPRILEPSEAFTVDVRIQGDGVDVPDLENVYFIVKNQRTHLSWDGRLHTYHEGLTAPGNEGIYPVMTELETQPLTGDKKIYVVDTTKPKSFRCEIAECETLPDVRKCVYEYKYEAQHSEGGVISCIESGWLSEGLYLPHCMLPSANRGDWNEDCELDSGGPESDTALMEEFLKKIPHQSERNSYTGCGDMDNDQDVDKDDLECLNNVVALKWFGDRGDGTCSIPMRGGFCFDIGAGIPGDYNTNFNFDPGDFSILGQILDTIG